MERFDDYSLVLGKRSAVLAEKYIEGLFHHWAINEIYLGNILTSVSNLILLLVEHYGGTTLSIEARLREEVISFGFTGVDKSVLQLFLKEYLLQDVIDNSTQSVFLIQRIADSIVVEDGKLILCFNTETLPEFDFAAGKHSFAGHYQR